MNNFEKIKDMSVEDFINAIDTEIFGEWNKNTITNWLTQDEVDWTKVPKDTKVLVKDSLSKDWIPRYFARYESNAITPYLVYESGTTSWTNEGKPLEIYRYCKLADDTEQEKFSIQDLIKEKCMNCHHFEFCGSEYIKCISKYIEDNFNISRKEKNNE